MEFVENEHKILKFWEKEKIFDKLREKNKKGKPWSFLDGPITANNPMGVHHAWGRTYKDMFQRYKAMQGFNLRFQNGFDCQGLWVEVEVEKELGFQSKKDIEKYGIEKFVEQCRGRVLKYSKLQTEQSKRLGQWMDWENSYYTMSDENNYAIWHFLKQCFQQGLLYKGRDVVPWCWRCGTAISQHEILTEEYKAITHQAVFFRLPLLCGEQAKGEFCNDPRTYFLVWTTTPWTLPGNSALAVHPDLDYVKVKDSQGDCYILLKDKADLVKGEIIEAFRGSKLEGLYYQGLFDGLPAVQKAKAGQPEANRIITWKEVTKEEGTGIVHMAPGCGAEDFKLSRELNLPVVDLTDNESRYRNGFGQLTGNAANSEQVRDWIFKSLEDKHLLFKIEDYTHRYPTCWRCKSELIFRLVNEWFIAMAKLRGSLMDSAKKINWLPKFGLERELDWLKNMEDWLISKKRYWGLALPIFECVCGQVEVIGSKQELKKKAVKGWKEFQGRSPHRPWIDAVEIKCSKCGAPVPRIKDVGTPWLDAGIVPFSTINQGNKCSVNQPKMAKKGEMPSYFSAQEYWQNWFPIDFICESFPGQFKNWFYVLLVQSQVLEGRAPFKTVLGFGTLVDENGEEMHKSKGNAIWFDEGVEKIGADVMRWMYSRANPANNLRFGYNLADETRRKIFTLVNCYTFFATYKPDKTKKSFRSEVSSSKSLLDKWVLSRLNRLIQETTKYLDNFDPMRASQAIEDFFINDLSLWYIRRSRQRFVQAAPILYYVLLNLTKLFAPFMPFLAEELYQKLRQKDMPQSAHLCDWPKADEKLIIKELEEQMFGVRQVVSSALAKRTEAGIKVRQPLASLKIRNPKSEIRNEKELLELIKDEVNVKQVVFDDRIKQEVELDTKISPALQQEGNLREVIRAIQSLRKKAGLTLSDGAIIYVRAEKGLLELIKAKEKDILGATRSSKLEFSVAPDKAVQKQVALAGQEIVLGLENR